jgi:hypothetical protein
VKKNYVSRARHSDPKRYAPDDPALVDTTVELNDDFTRSVIINELEFVDVACVLSVKSTSVGVT